MFVFDNNDYKSYVRYLQITFSTFKIGQNYYFPKKAMHLSIYLLAIEFLNIFVKDFHRYIFIAVEAVDLNGFIRLVF